MPKCKYEYEPRGIGVIPPEIPLDCEEQSTKNGEFCIFHDKNHYSEHEQEAAKRFEEKVIKSYNRNEPLICFGYYLPSINFTSLLDGISFEQPVFFNGATFTGDAHFYSVTFTREAQFRVAAFTGAAYFEAAAFTGGVDFRVAAFTRIAYFEAAAFTGGVEFWNATFSERVDFGKATFTGDVIFAQTKFLSEAYFLTTKFEGKVVFQYANFEQPNKVTFDDTDLSNVSFADCDITRIRFGDKITWGKGNDKFTIIEEEWLREKARGQTKTEIENVTLELVLSVYRNLRENYEFRLRYDDAGKFFIKEMELKRKYRQVDTQIKDNGWFRRNFSLTGLYYHLSRYGESISRPTLIGAITVILSTLFWLTQSNPFLEPHFYPSAEPDITSSTFIGFAQVGNGTQWLKAFERSFADFLPLISLGGDIKVGVIDYIIKIVGGALTFGLLLIAFRRKFERKYTR